MPNLRYEYPRVRDVNAGPGLQIPNIIPASAHGDLTASNPFGSFLQGASKEFIKQQDEKRTQKQALERQTAAAEAQIKADKAKTLEDEASLKRQTAGKFGPEYRASTAFPLELEKLKMSIAATRAATARTEVQPGGGETVPGEPENPFSGMKTKELDKWIKDQDGLIARMESSPESLDPQKKKDNQARIDYENAWLVAGMAVRTGKTFEDAKKIAGFPERVTQPEPQPQTQVTSPVPLPQLPTRSPAPPPPPTGIPAAPVSPPRPPGSGLGGNTSLVRGPQDAYGDFLRLFPQNLKAAAMLPVQAVQAGVNYFSPQPQPNAPPPPTQMPFPYTPPAPVGQPNLLR